MIDDNPQGNGDDAPVSEKDTMDALTDILGDPETDTDEGKVQADDSQEGDDAEDGEDADGENSEDSDDDDASEDGDEPDDLKGGRFAPHSAKVRLPDGQTTTVEELMKGGLRQSDYSRKTESLARERDEFQDNVERLNQTTQQLEQQREFIDAVLEQWRPQPPENPDNDPTVWIEFQQREHAWNQWKNHIETGLKQSRDNFEKSRTEELQKAREREEERLFQAIPAMRDPGKRQRIATELARFGTAEYGFTQQEMASIGDHRMIKVLFDLHQAKARTAKAPGVVEKVKEKPKVMRGSNRAKGKDGAKRSRMERLRETGWARDAETALMDLDL